MKIVGIDGRRPVGSLVALLVSLVALRRRRRSIHHSCHGHRHAGRPERRTATGAAEQRGPPDTRASLDSSVFPAPPCAALTFEPRRRCQAARDVGTDRGLSMQTFNLLAKVFSSSIASSTNPGPARRPLPPGEVHPECGSVPHRRRVAAEQAHLRGLARQRAPCCAAFRSSRSRRASGAWRRRRRARRLRGALDRRALPPRRARHLR